ncbi:uncharacterized protein LOC120265717 [Dioscorea cayenensis subsp. rotundata]|uniref:Uncharacterized protein LOC120265717 n=1 Tax=Dioscorea cayennensis subsp. rotundata TaxID=55577 RepID=A0AB40BTL7_DIOCR|nr:uncharacterized protein LOC120265717 [Dioscorea cayenensis subsp. rotundata]XP_039129602.1 uncharacterized protein LOC120265717 [Dioscorea cayenensis subsp. rotundata]XP_039129603.1 uncharacterized protein LOC120265717 [Dioscorea cayenensis subsp. rotundata]
MPITHADLVMRQRRINENNAKLAQFLLVLSVLCGLLSFVLCLAGEAARSEVSWLIVDRACAYKNSGRTSLLCGVFAFVLLATAMFAEHACMLIAVTSPKPPAVVPWTAPEDPRPSHASKKLTIQACALIIATWVCFAIAELLLIISIGIESGHTSDWQKARLSCPAVRPGLYVAAGVFGLLTVLLGVGLYLTALRAQKLNQEEANMPPSNPPHFITPTAPPQTVLANKAPIPA